MRDMPPAQEIGMVKMASCSGVSATTAFIGDMTAQDWLLYVSIAVQVIVLLYSTIKFYDYLVNRKKRSKRHDDQD